MSCAVSGEATLHTLSFEECVKLCPGGLTPMIRTETLDAPHVSSRPRQQMPRGVESLNFGAEEGDARVVRVVVCECDNNICCPPDPGQEKGTRLSGLPHQICLPVVQRACPELACGWSLHARTNRMCTLSEMRIDCI